MARCDSCNKFVPYEDPAEVTVDDVAFDGGTFEADVSVTLRCEECGQDLKTGSDHVEAEVADEHFTASADHPGTTLKDCIAEEGAEDNTDDHDWTVDDTSPDAEADVRTEGKGRGTRTFYGGTFTAEASCDRCGGKVSRDMEVFIQASSFDDA